MVYSAGCWSRSAESSIQSHQTVSPIVILKEASSVDLTKDQIVSRSIDRANRTYVLRTILKLMNSACYNLDVIPECSKFKMSPEA